jgi:CRP/FNR family transcriptional regulator, cyclic AMP receptor protein
VNSILSLCDGLPEAAFDAGQSLLDEGSRTGVLYVLIEGEVEILKGDFQVDTVSNAGAIFGEVSALTGIPHMATVRALTNVRAYRIQDAARFLHSQPQIAIEVARLLAHRLNGVTNYLVDLKQQFETQTDHLAIVGDVLETIVHQQRIDFNPGSDRDPDPTL